MALDATVGGTTANSYVTRVRGLELMAMRLHTATFDALPVEDQDKAFMMATRLLDSLVCIVAPKTTAEQALRFPATSLSLHGHAVADDVIPFPIEDSTVELARLLASTDYSAPSDAEAQGLTKLKVGPIELGFREILETRVVPQQVIGRIPADWLCPTAIEVLATKNRKAEFRML